jgi:hypothetical protein
MDHNYVLVQLVFASIFVSIMHLADVPAKRVTPDRLWEWAVPTPTLHLVVSMRMTPKVA